MPLESDFSNAPYFNDYDPSKNFERILWQPSLAVQTRELNQLQDLLQAQIERFGNNIFKRGTVIDGVNFSFFDRYPYAKIQDVQINGEIAVPSAYVGYFARSENGLVASIINSADGFESTDPDLKTLYVKYINSGDSYSETKFAAGQILTIYDANDSIHSVDIVAAGSAYSNSDVVVFTPQLVVNVTSGSISVGDTFTDPVTQAQGVVVSTRDQQRRVPRNVLPGTVSVTPGSNVTGTATHFSNDFANGDYIAVYSNSTSYEARKINVVSNSTFMNLTSNISFSNTAATYANTTDSLVYVQYRPVPGDLSNTLATSADWTFSTGNTVQGNTVNDTFTVIGVVGTNAAAGVTTDSAGKIIAINVTNRGSGYPLVPYTTVKSSTGTSANLAALNYLAQVTVSSLAGSVGSGYAFGVSEGIIYQKGYFVRVEPQVAIIDKYSQAPDEVTVGFDTLENIINSNIDPSLLDNAAGYDNETAPGADRLQLVPTLVVKTLNDASANAEFFELVEWSGGFPYKQNKRTAYNVIQDNIATGIDDAHGSFVTDRFLVTTTSPANTALAANTISIVVDPGIAYIEGHRIETTSNFITNTPKATDTLVAPNARVSLNYENYTRVKEVGGMFEFDRAGKVNLQDAAKGYLSNNSLYTTSNLSAAGNKIGEARIRNFVLEQGVPGTPEAVYRMYLFDVRMNVGKNFRDVRSIWQDNVNFDGVCDTVLTLDPTTNTNIASIMARNNYLVFQGGFESPLNANNIDYVYRTIDDSREIANTGIITVSLTGDPNKTFPYTGTLSDAQKAEIFVAPTANLVAQANLTGTVNTTATSANVTGNGTAFLSELQAGQYINIVGGGANTVINRIVSIANNTFLTLAANAGFTDTTKNIKRAWAAYAPIQLSYNSNITANVTTADQVLNINIGSTLNVASNTDIVIAYNVYSADATPTTKTPNRNKLVKLRLANNVGGTSGPWCLGIPDVFRLRSVYLGNSSVTTASSEVTDNFFVDNNQNSNYYNLSYLYKEKGDGILLTDDDYLLVEYDAYTAPAGFYTVGSYVSSTKSIRFAEDSKPLANLTTTVNTLEIPEFFDDAGFYYDLVQCVDFRPYVDATANITSNTSLLTINPANTVSFASADRYFPVPDSIYEHEVEYFLPRIDSVVLDKNSKISIIQGTPGKNRPPIVAAGSMRLNNLQVPVYPALPEQADSQLMDIVDTRVYSNKYNSTRLARHKIRTLFSERDFSREQPRNWTMSDIGDINRRVENLEYYALLNSVQSMLKDRVIPSSVSPNIDRFKYGFFVDDYDTFDYSQTDSPEYNASIIASYALPPMTAFNAVHEGGLTSSPYTAVKLVSQDNATEDDPPVPPPPTTYTGTLTITPALFKTETYRLSPGLWKPYTVPDVGASSTEQPTNTGKRKIVCTAMNEAYGFGSFRQTIWLEQAATMDPAYERGYHALFLPVVDWIYGSKDGDTPFRSIVRKVGERIARKRTADIWKQKRGKRDIEGAVYRAILEPLCYVVGKIKG